MSNNWLACTKNNSVDVSLWLFCNEVWSMWFYRFLETSPVYNSSSTGVVPFSAITYHAAVIEFADTMLINNPTDCEVRSVIRFFKCSKSSPCWNLSVACGGVWWMMEMCVNGVSFSMKEGQMCLMENNLDVLLTRMKTRQTINWWGNSPKLVPLYWLASWEISESFKVCSLSDC